MSALGQHPRYRNHSRRYWLTFYVGLVLGLGIGVYFWIDHVLAEPAVATLIAVGAMLLATACLVLTVCLRATRKELGAIHHEISKLQAREKLLKAQAHHDGLTGLANRILLADRFHFAVERAKRSGKSFALLMVDLNDFKTVNDRYGHAVGDTVLITMARRLVGAVRASDTVARLGGDEFVLIIESIENPQELVHISEKLFDTLSDSISLESGVVVDTGASVGLALYPEDGADMNDLLNVADQAMYECKATGLMALQ